MYNRKNIYFIAFVLYLLALPIRLYSITEFTPQADEKHWQSRSSKLYRNLRDGHWSTVTSHLTHPGVPPAFVMATGQAVRSQYLKSVGKYEGYRGRFDSLSASRIANALTSSLVVPMLFLGTVSILGLAISFLAAGMLIFDPHLIGLSRQAHLDALLTLFVVSTIVIFVRAVRENSVLLKLSAGLCWGLCVLTKPTAVALLPGLFLYKPLRNFYHRMWLTDASSSDERHGEKTILSWSDFGALVSGVVLFALCYSRMWTHDSPYRLRLKIVSGFADSAYSLGLNLASNLSMVISVSFALILASLICLRRLNPHRRGRRYSLKRSAAFLGCTLGALLSALALFPQVFENLIRFAVWVAGLSGEGHRAYGIQWSPPEYGYLTLLITELPTLVILGLFLAVFAFISHLASRSRWSHPERSTIILFFTLITVLWIVPLSISSKQTLRYVMPVVPILYLIAAYGLYNGLVQFWFAVVRDRFPRFQKKFGLFLKIALCSIVTFQGFVAASWSPNFNLYFNDLSGGLSGAVHRSSKLVLAGVPEALEFLHTQEPFVPGSKPEIIVVGDPEVMKFSDQRLFPEKERLRFTSSKLFSGADYLVLFPQFLNMLDSKSAERVLATEPIFVYRERDVRLLAVYRVPAVDFQRSKKFFIPMKSTVRHTGHCRELTPDQYASHSTFDISGKCGNVIVKQGSDKKGYALFGVNLLIHPGNYSAQYLLSAPPGLGSLSDRDPERFVVRLDFGACSTIVKAGQIVSEQPIPIDIACKFENRTRAKLRAYWFGNHSLSIAGVSVEKLDTD